jgi:Protein kinase domain
VSFRSGKGTLRLVAEVILGSRYRLTGQLGAGGMGVVWRAHDLVLDREVAVKVLAPQFARDADSRRRILTEARAAARLTHPHVASVYDYGYGDYGAGDYDYGESTSDPGGPVPYVVMELLHGRSLQERLQRGPLSVEVALRICAEVASALAAAHTHGLVHRDVKPGNVMLTAGGAKVVDFGLAAVAGERDLTEGLAFGTPAYLAPERLSGDPVVAATDVYALGLLLYRMLAGRLPWSAETSTQMLEAHMYLEPTPLPKLPGVPPVVRDLVGRCLAKDPAQRPLSGEVAVTLAHSAGVRVPLDTVDDDELDDPAGGVWSSPHVSDSDGALGWSPSEVIRSDPLAALRLGGVPGHDPYAARLAQHLDASLDHVNLRRQGSLLLRGSVGFDLAIWAVLDPMTLMWASCVVDGGPHDERFEHELFANEYGQDDVLKLVDLETSQRIGTLHAGTLGDPTASRRYRAILQPRGFSDELRMTFHDAEGTWGALLLYRAGGRFGAEDVAQLTSAAHPFGAALHNALVRGDPVPDAAKPDDPGSETPPEPGAAAPPSRPRRWRKPRDRHPADAAPGEPVPAAPGKPVPAAPGKPVPAAPGKPERGILTISRDGRLLDVTATARKLIDAAELDKVGTAVARGRPSGLIDPSGGVRYDGRWLAFHATQRETAIDVTVQRIRPNQLSEFVVRARGLEPWHWHLLGGLARGRITRQIAQDLDMSVYAVQDGMTSLFRAFRVSGRIELLKTLFFDHYVPLHASDAKVAPER